MSRTTARALLTANVTTAFDGIGRGRKSTTPIAIAPGASVDGTRSSVTARVASPPSGRVADAVTLSLRTGFNVPFCTTTATRLSTGALDATTAT